VIIESFNQYKWIFNIFFILSYQGLKQNESIRQQISYQIKEFVFSENIIKYELGFWWSIDKVKINHFYEKWLKFY
jgi:hypothetical protein